MSPTIGPCIAQEPDGCERIHLGPVLRYVPDVAPPEDLPESRRCACCGAPMPADVGVWIVAIDAAGALAVVCSQECARGEDFPP